MMRTLNLYIIRRIFAPFSLTLTVLLMVLSLERLLRLVQIVTEQHAPGYKTFEFLFYLLPHYLGLALPASLFLGILMALRRLQEDSELAVIQNAGLSLRSLYKPVAIIALPATLFMLCLTSYGQPHARYAYRAALHDITADNPLGGLRSGVFVEIAEGTVLRANNIDRENGILEGIFIAREKTNPPEQLVISAQRARLTHDEDTQIPILRLENGNLMQESKQKISELSFESYPWSLPGLLGEAYGPRGQDEREMVLGELFKGGVKDVQTTSTSAQIITEFHVRIIHALSLLFLALWAVPLALIGSGRTGKAGGIILGAGLLVLYEKLLGLGEAYAAHGNISVWLALWLPFFTLGLSGWIFMCMKMPRRLNIEEVRS